MKILSVTDRLSLHRELELESILAQQMEGISRRHRVSNGRGAARGLLQRKNRYQLSLSLSSWSFETAFSEVAETTSVALPIAGLSDWLNLRLALARVALLEERRKRLAAHFEA